MKIHLVIAACAAALLIPAAAGARAQDRCVERAPCTSETAGNRISRELRDAREDVRRSTSVTERVNRTREAVEECARCALEAAQDAAIRAARRLGSPSPQSEDNPPSEPDDPESRLD